MNAFIYTVRRSNCCGSYYIVHALADRRSIDAMGAWLWDDVWNPLLIGVAIAIVVAALRFLSVRLPNCLTKLILEVQTAVGGSAHDQPLPDSAAAAAAAAAAANGVPDSEMGNCYGPAEGGESVTEPVLELRIVNSGEVSEIAGIEHFSDLEAQTPVIQSPMTSTSFPWPSTQWVAALPCRLRSLHRDAARGALAPVEMDVPPHSQQEEGSPWSPSLNVSSSSVANVRSILGRVIRHFR